MEGKASNEDSRMKIRNVSALKKCANHVLLKYMRCAVAFSQGCFDVLHALGPNFLLEQKELIFQDMLMVICSHS